MRSSGGVCALGLMVCARVVCAARVVWTRSDSVRSVGWCALGRMVCARSDGVRSCGERSGCARLGGVRSGGLPLGRLGWCAWVWRVPFGWCGLIRSVSVRSVLLGRMCGVRSGGECSGGVCARVVCRSGSGAVWTRSDGVCGLGRMDFRISESWKLTSGAESGSAFTVLAITYHC